MIILIYDQIQNQIFFTMQHDKNIFKKNFIVIIFFSNILKIKIDYI